MAKFTTMHQRLSLRSGPSATLSAWRRPTGGRSALAPVPHASTTAERTRFNEDTVDVIFQARTAAQKAGQSVADGHLLWSLASEASWAAELLRERGITAEGIQNRMDEAAVELVQPDRAARLQGLEAAFTRRAEQAVAASGEKARLLGKNWACGECQGNYRCE